MNFLIRWLVNGAGFYTAIMVVPGITTQAANTWDLVLIAVVAGLVNTVLSPIFKFFTFPFVFLTLGLWLLVANVIMFWFAGSLGEQLGFGFRVHGFWPTVWGAIIVSVVSSVFGFLLSGATRKK
jgi:putative membrane protein